MSLSERQRQIYTLLQRKQILTFAEVRDQFQISLMTAHRDIDQLVRAEKAEKIHGGVRLNSKEILDHQSQDCAYCQKTISPRTAFVIHLSDRRQVFTCCPHCGLLYLAQAPGVGSAMAVDFLYGHRVNVKDAAFLAGGEINLCCTPSILCLDQVKDAVRLQAGFGGQVLTFPQAVEFVRQAMQVEIDPPHPRR